MGTLYCPEAGGHPVKVRFNPAPGERYCPEHGTPLQQHEPSGSRKPLARGGRHESSAEARARRRFNAIVTTRRCYFSDTTFAGEPRRPGHKCRYPLDAHHLIPKEWMRRELSLSEDELLAVMYDPIIGAPLCRNAHDAVERRADFIYFAELNDDLIQLCERFDARRLDERSLLQRLKSESPQKPQPRQSLPAAANEEEKSNAETR